MTPVTLQISLPEELELTKEELTKITGRPTVAAQIRWLDDKQWAYTLSADRGVIVGKLYAHLRLAGLHPVDVDRTPAGAGGFNLDATR
jgi:hypothetical protein